MTYDIYSIRDHYSAFGTPYCHANQNTAKRHFARIVNNSDGDISFSPRDYDLYLVGQFDDQSGRVSVVDPVEFIANGADFVGVKTDEK